MRRLHPDYYDDEDQDCDCWPYNGYNCKPPTKGERLLITVFMTLLVLSVVGPVIMWIVMLLATSF